MFGRAFIILSAVAVPAAYSLGMFGGGGIDRVVGASPDQIRAALTDLDIRKAPGAPATDPSRSGGVEPVFHLTQEGDDMVWTVMSGKDIAVRMIAHLEPVDGGAKTRVTAHVERGNAPDDFVAPAFRSKGITLGLFSIVLEDELDDLVRPATRITEEECGQLAEKLLAANAPPPEQQTGFAGGVRTMMTLSAVEQEVKSKGCDTGFKGGFKEMKSELKDADSVSGSAPMPEVTFEAGKPMVDLSKGR